MVKKLKLKIQKYEFEGREFDIKEEVKFKFNTEIMHITFNEQI